MLKKVQIETASINEFPTKRYWCTRCWPTAYCVGQFNDFNATESYLPSCHRLLFVLSGFVKKCKSETKSRNLLGPKQPIAAQRHLCSGL